MTMIKKHNSLFLALVAVSVILTGLIVADNLQDAREASLAQRAATTEGYRKHFAEMKLPLHEGKYWTVLHGQ